SFANFSGCFSLTIIRRIRPRGMDAGHIFPKDPLGSISLNNGKEGERKVATRISHSRSKSGDAERLAGRSPAENVNSNSSATCAGDDFNFDSMKCKFDSLFFDWLMALAPRRPILELRHVAKIRNALEPSVAHGIRKILNLSIKHRHPPETLPRHFRRTNARANRSESFFVIPVHPVLSVVKSAYSHSFISICAPDWNPSGAYNFRIEPSATCESSFQMPRFVSASSIALSQLSRSGLDV